MTTSEYEQRLIEIESALANQERMIEDLNQVIIGQGKTIDFLVKQNRCLLENLKTDEIKPLSEETPPPHY